MLNNGGVDPSELHLKKELNALGKAKLLRDPETSSSWRSPLSSRSLTATCGWNFGNGADAANNNPGGFFENNRKKVFLHNWRHHSSKSSYTRDNRQVTTLESPKDSSSDAAQKSDADSIMGFRETTPARRRVTKLKKNTKGGLGLGLDLNMDLPSTSSLGVVNSVDQSDDCNSEDSRLLESELARKKCYTSGPASPFLLSGYENWSNSSKIKNTAAREVSPYSCTPASTTSYNRYGNRIPSTVESWDGTTESFDVGDLNGFDIPGRQGCGIPCYWSKRTKHRGCGDCYSPSLSNTLRRKGSSILCGSQTLYHRRGLPTSHKQKFFPKSGQGLPLLTNCDGRRSSTDTASDELSTNFGELDLEALSRLDGRRWSSCRSQEGIALALTSGAEEEMPDHRSLSQKYAPMSFSDLIGQNIVVQSLTSAISRGRIAPVYLFQGPRGTGKTSTARIFAAALNCLSIEEIKPCGFCRECTEFVSGKRWDVREVDATNKKGIHRVRCLLKNLSVTTTFSRYTVFIIDQCHLLPSKTWSAFLKFLDDPPSSVVFLFITIDLDNLPRIVLSRCQKYLFPKIKDADIVIRLKKLSAKENLDVEFEALDLIALKSDGSLRDAETMLEQLSLLGKTITTALVNDLAGVVSDEKLLDLLELAMSSDTAETVKRARELMDSGVDPVALMSQLAGLIMDIIAGTYRLVDSKCTGPFFGGRNLTTAELERLKNALKILSEAEKQLRLSSERSTWFTAALLQLGSGHSPDTTYSSSSSKQSPRKKREYAFDTAKEASSHEKNLGTLNFVSKSNSAPMLREVGGHSNFCGSPSCSTALIELPTCSRFLEDSALGSANNDSVATERVFSCISPNKLDEIWRKCIERCHSKTLRQLLYVHGKLVSISEARGVLIAFIAFGDEDIKSRAERFLSSITNSIEMVLRYNVEVRLEIMPDAENLINGIRPVALPNFVAQNQMEMTSERRVASNTLNCSSVQDLHKEPLVLPRKSFNDSEVKLRRTLACDGSSVPDGSLQTESLPIFWTEGNIKACIIKEKKQDISMQIHAAVDEQRLETAWLQAAEKGTPGLGSQLKPEKNQVLPQDGISDHIQMASVRALTVSSKHWEDELNHEIKALKISDNQSHQREQNTKRADYFAMSPSLLHNSSFATKFDKENLGYESGTGCNGLLCWKTAKPHKGKVKQGTRVRSHKPGRFLCFGRSGKLKTREQIEKMSE